mmetsp:Transcript_30386/g.98137  ORF Transcript_30386/g.98137 Transcript_30386/m.98137 type:complete len:229 (-) Transcript_30386:110-796(-)
MLPPRRRSPPTATAVARPRQHSCCCSSFLEENRRVDCRKACGGSGGSFRRFVGRGSVSVGRRAAAAALAEGPRFAGVAAPSPAARAELDETARGAPTYAICASRNPDHRPATSCWVSSRGAPGDPTPPPGLVIASSGGAAASRAGEPASARGSAASCASPPCSLPSRLAIRAAQPRRAAGAAADGSSSPTCRPRVACTSHQGGAPGGGLGCVRSHSSADSSPREKSLR